MNAPGKVEIVEAPEVIEVVEGDPDGLLTQLEIVGVAPVTAPTVRTVTTTPASEVAVVAPVEAVVLEGVVTALHTRAEIVEIVGVTPAGTNPPVLTVVADGQQGPAGAAGSTWTFVHAQLVPAVEWRIVHNLNGHPSVSVVDSAGGLVFGDVVYLSPTEILIRFSAALGGHAYLS